MSDKLRKFTIDEGFIEEAHPDNFKKEKRRLSPVKRLALLGTALSLLAIALCCWLFIPYPNQPKSVEKFSQSPYYDLIDTINKATFTPPRYKNNWQWLSSSFRSLVKFEPNGGGMANDMAPGATAEGLYTEVTDNQVTGVIEGDKFKRTTSHVFYLDHSQGSYLKVYTIEKEASKEVSSLNLATTCLFDGESVFASLPSEIFLSKDGNTVILIAQISSDDAICTRIAQIDYTDKQSPAVTKLFTVSGKYNTARLVDDSLILVSNYTVNTAKINFNRPETFVPSAGEGQTLTPVTPTNIIMPDDGVSSAPRYTAIYLFDVKTLEALDCNAFLDYHNNVYANSEAIYLTRSFVETKILDDGKVRTERNATEIFKTPYTENGFMDGVSTFVYGQIKDQYSLDVYDGYLRAVTTVMDRTYTEGQYGPYESFMALTKRLTSASLYVLDDKNLSPVSQAYAFAPNGETVRSVRFDGTKAYVCTAIEVTDPVFFFDLSDVNNLTYTDTGTIPGFSTSLINLKDGLLLGIGTESGGGDLKMEIYFNDQGTVTVVDSKLYKNCTYSEDYKSYLILREEGLVGLAVSDHTERDYPNMTSPTVYMLFKIENAKLRLTAEKISGEPGLVRAFVDEGYLYILHGGITVKKL